MKKIVFSLSKGLHYVAQLILAIMMILITFDVLGRWLFSKPIKGTVDLTELGLSMVIFLSLAYTHVRKEHISVDFLVEKLSQKVQRIFDIVINIIIAGLMLLMAWSLYGNVQRLNSSNTISGDLGLPIYIFAILAVIGAIAFALIAIVWAIDDTKKVVNKDES